MKNLENKVVWVTGASSGIGRELIIQLAKEKCNIVLSARREDELLKTVEIAGLNKERYFILPLDLSNKEIFSDKTKAVLEHFGQIDVLINNGGIAQKSLSLNTNTAVENKIMDINYFGTIALSKSVCEIMKKQKFGKIATVTSILGKFGLPYAAAYSASKHALHGYFESLRYEVEKHGIQIQLIVPGFINTEIVKKSLTEDGSPYNENSVAQKKGTSPQFCAKQIVKAIKGNRKTVYIGGKETFMPIFKGMFPSVFYKLMKKMHKL